MRSFNIYLSTQMNTNQIDAILRRDKFTSKYYVGTFSCDMLPSPSSLPPVFALCVNTDSSYSPLGGRHWQSIFVRKGKLYFFDSFGQPPKGRIRAFCIRFPFVYYNLVAHQQPSAITCGAFAIYHIHMQSRGRSFRSIVHDFVKISNDDQAVTNWISHAHHFNSFNA